MSKPLAGFPSVPLEAALAYARRGWHVHPCGQDKRPLTPHGLHDATRDDAQIRAWWGSRWPRALIAIATGEPSGVVALDIDVREAGSGLDTLQEIGVTTHPRTVTAHTPSGGIHCLFAWPRRHVPCSAGRIGRFLDVRGDGGYLIVPPGPGRVWDPHLDLDTPLAEMPAWMDPREPEQKPAPEEPPKARRQPLSRYAEVALDSAVQNIIRAAAGAQEITLNRESYAIGQLAAGGVIPSGLALEGLLLAARHMPSHDPRRPWRPVDLERKVKAAFTDGLRKPRQAPDARR